MGRHARRERRRHARPGPPGRVRRAVMVACVAGAAAILPPAAAAPVELGAAAGRVALRPQTVATPAATPSVRAAAVRIPAPAPQPDPPHKPTGHRTARLARPTTASPSRGKATKPRPPAAPARRAPAPPATRPAAASRAAAVVAFVRAQLGKPYVLGATGPDAYDCSGLVQAAYATIGITLPRVSQAQSTAGTPVPPTALHPGDILYWGPPGAAYHVAIYVGGGNFIGAQNPASDTVLRPLSNSPPSGAVRVLA
jgi:peptidoglycan DL-endopeptidase CwlO